MSNSGMGPTTLGVRVSCFSQIVLWSQHIYCIYCDHGSSSVYTEEWLAREPKHFD